MTGFPLIPTSADKLPAADRPVDEALSAKRRRLSVFTPVRRQGDGPPGAEFNAANIPLVQLQRSARRRSRRRVPIGTDDYGTALETARTALHGRSAGKGNVPGCSRGPITIPTATAHLRGFSRNALEDFSPPPFKVVLSRTRSYRGPRGPADLLRRC